MAKSGNGKAELKALKDKVAAHMAQINAARAAIRDLEVAASPDILALVEAAPVGALFDFGGEIVRFRKAREGGYMYALPAGETV